MHEMATVLGYTYIARLVGIYPHKTVIAYVSHSQNDKTAVFIVAPCIL